MTKENNMTEPLYRKLTPLKQQDSHYLRIPNTMIPEGKKLVKIWAEEGKVILEFVYGVE